MTNRLKYHLVWAQEGDATDPDLDTTQPLFIPDRYENVGWKAEKPPEEWQNFINQINDLKIKDVITSGIPQWEVGLTYEPNSLVYEEVSGKLYLNISGKRTIAPLSDTKVWGSSVGGDSGEFLAEVESMRNKLQAHVNADNPHNDNVSTLVDGTYLKGDVDKMFSDKTDSRTLAYHMAQVGAAHKETPAQVGTLPKEGGTFTGDVGFERAVMFPTGGFVHYNLGAAVIELVLGNNGIGIDSVGNAYVRNGSAYYLLLSERNYNTLEMAVNQKFVAEMPYFRMAFSGSLSDGDSIGDWVVLTDKVPSFDLRFGLQVSDNGMKFEDFIVKQDYSQVRLVGGNNGTPVELFGISKSGSYATLAEFLTRMGWTSSVTHIKLIEFYRSALTKYQQRGLNNVTTS